VNNVVISKWKDLIERVGWTFLQAEIALGLLDWLTAGINLSFVHQVYVSLGAALAATIKVFIGQQVGKSDSGSIPDTSKP
jgi:hypothetical protein